MKLLTLSQWVALLCDLTTGRPEDSMFCHLKTILIPLMKIYTDTYNINYGTEAGPIPMPNIQQRYGVLKDKHFPGASAQYLREIVNLLTNKDYQPSDLLTPASPLLLIDALVVITAAQEIGNAALSNQIKEWVDKRAPAAV